MLKAIIYNKDGKDLKEIDLDPQIFEVAINPELVHQAVIAHQANSRQILASTKDKGEVSGGGKKPWKQKGTGRARHGSIRSPLWRGGGITFGPTNNRNFSLKINKKAKKKALLMALSSKAAAKKIIFVDQLELDEAKTKNFFKILENLKLRNKKVDIAKKEKKEKTNVKKTGDKEKSVLVILPEKNDNIKRSARNISKISIINAQSLNIYDVLKNQYMLMPVEAIEIIKKTFVNAAK